MPDLGAFGAASTLPGMKTAVQGAMALQEEAAYGKALGLSDDTIGEVLDVMQTWRAQSHRYISVEELCRRIHESLTLAADGKE